MSDERTRVGRDATLETNLNFIMHSNKTRLTNLLQRKALDIVGPLEPPTSRANCYVLVIVDYLTKFAKTYATPNQTLESVAKIVVFEFTCRFGILS